MYFCPFPYCTSRCVFFCMPKERIVIWSDRSTHLSLMNDGWIRATKIITNFLHVGKHRMWTNLCWRMPGNGTEAEERACNDFHRYPASQEVWNLNFAVYNEEGLSWGCLCIYISLLFHWSLFYPQIYIINLVYSIY